MQRKAWGLSFPSRIRGWPLEAGVWSGGGGKSTRRGGAMPLAAMFAGIPECYDHEVFQHLLQREIKRSLRYAEFFSLCLLSPDQLNLQGWGNDDERAQSFLAVMFENIRQEVRNTDFIGRYGNHLAAVLVYSSVEEARVAAERVRERIGRFIFPSEFSTGSSRVTVSVGCACFPTDGRDLASLRRCALLSLRQAREAGGNRAVMFQELDGKG